ncbi:MAG: hypothetical protein F6K41_07725 [Symploca sp. SIO3E6]|nr:hypothetical protein [Caldora sp. SIO3E6]
MTQRLKRWESPRRQGRNDKGKGGSARRRQLKKQTQMLRKKLKKGQKAKNQNHNRGREFSSLPLCLELAIARASQLRYGRSPTSSSGLSS